MTKQSYRYPKDEFDNVPEDAPTGAHRAPRSSWHKVVPFVVVAVVFAALAYGGVTLISNALDSNDASASTSAGAASSTKPPAKASSTTKATPKKTSTSTATTSASDADVDRTTSVRVLNGAGISGLAGRGAAKLTADGFTHVVAADYTGAKLAESTVYYSTADDKATAEHVASLLDVSAVQQVSSLSAPVTVVLATDLS